LSKKISNLLSALLAISIGVGLIFSSSVRSNLMGLLDSFSSSGVAGLIFAILLAWFFRGVPKTIIKIYKAKGINSKFWKED
jgi:xanthine/uracil permease